MITKLSKYIKINMQSFSDSFYRGFFEKRKGAGTRFPSHIFFGIFPEKFSFVKLNNLAKFHY